jgi:hypothetical protein
LFLLARTCFAWPLREASPLERLLGFYEPLDRALPLGPAVFFRDARVENVKPFQYPPTPLGVHRRVPFGPSFCATLTSVFDLALLEESDSLLVKLLLGTGVVAALGAFVLVAVGALLGHVRIDRANLSYRPRLRRGYTLREARRLQACNVPARMR